MGKKTNLGKNTIILSICTLLNKGLMFVMVPFFSRWLSVEEYGTYDLLATYVTLLIPIVTLATSNAVFRLSVDVDSEDGKKAYITNGFLLVTANLFFSIILISVFSIWYGWSHYIAFLSLLVAEVLDNYFQGFLRAIKKLSLYAICKTVSVVAISVSVTIFVRVFGMGLDGLLLGYACGFLLEVIVIFFWTNYWKYFQFQRFSFKRIKELVGYSYPLIPNDISWWVINVSDRMIINLILGAASNGIYAIAYKVPNLCSAVFGVFNISWQETASEMIHEVDRDAYFNSIYNKMYSLLLALCAGILSCNFIFFDYIFDARYSGGRVYTPILVTSIIFSMLSQYFGGIQIGLKRPKANGITTMIGALVNIGVHICLVKGLGLYAAAISTLLSTVVVMALRRYLLRKSFDFHLNNIQLIYTFIYIYFVIVSYIQTQLIFSIINFFGACVFFGVVNKDTVTKMVNKLLLRR